MLRFRGELVSNVMSVQLVTSRRFIRRLPYASSSASRCLLSCPLLSLPSAPSPSLSAAQQPMILFDVPLCEAKRCFRAQTRKTSDAASEGAETTNNKAAGSSQQSESKSGDASSKEGAADGKAKEDEAPRPTGVAGWLEGLRRDMVEFPDIYNSANAINFILFTVFCLCSTGSNVEADWWRNTFGVDSAFKPLAWIFHSAVMDNFLSMTFAMMLLHTMSHSVLPTIGSRGLLMYCSIVGVASGVLMWAFQAVLKAQFQIETEKQFGPWDVVAGLMVMQFLHQGFAPWQILNSFNGWVRYACWVGAVCICYYDAQPTALGAAIGLVLCKKHPKFRVSGPAV